MCSKGSSFSQTISVTVFSGFSASRFSISWTHRNWRLGLGHALQIHKSSLLRVLEGLIGPGRPWPMRVTGSLPFPVHAVIWRS